ncbi:MAG TPA: acyltransferase, partial [Chitinolyticbacter sp.]|nr:acyltransferase [Chitinolyticbacter sp.]
MSTAQASRHWAQMGEHTFVFGIWLLFWVYRLLGRWPFRICLYAVVFVHWACRPALRQASLQYLQRVQAATGALGHVPDWRDSLRHIALFAETLLDKLLAVSGRYRFERVRTEGREAVYEAGQAGQGGLIVTAHIGCLELCRAMAEARGVLRLNVLVHTRHALRFNQMLRRLNPTHDVNLIEVTEISPTTAVV